MEYLTREEIKSIVYGGKIALGSGKSILSNGIVRSVLVKKRVIDSEKLESVDFKNPTEEDKKMIASALLNKINKEDYEYITKEIEYGSAVLLNLIIDKGDPEFTKECVINYKKHGLDSCVRLLIEEIEDREFIKECVRNYEIYKLDRYDVTKLIESTNDSEFVRECILDYQKYKFDKSELMILTSAIDDESIIIDFMNNKNNLPLTKDDIIKSVASKKDEHLTKKIILKSENLKFDEFKTLINGLEHKKRINCLENVKDGIKQEYIGLYRKECDDLEFVKDNLEFFMKLENVGEEEILKKKDYIMQMSQINNEVVKNIDFKILDQKYIEKLGINKINQISSYPDVQEQVINLKDSQIKVFSQCISNCKSSKWTPLAQAFLENLPQYQELIENISQAEGEFDYEKLNIIIQDKNIFDLNTLEDVQNYEQIKQKKCDEWINSDDIYQKKLAVLEKLYGISLEYSETLIRKYAQDIEKIQDGDYKDYVRSVKAILNVNNPSILEKIYEQCKEVENIDKISIEEGIKGEYCKLYNEGLFNIDEAQKFEEGIYEAGTDFKMIVTVLSPFEDNRRTIEDYKKDWNRPSIEAQHFCASYIRNDMLGIASNMNNQRLCYRILQYVK